MDTREYSGEHVPEQPSEQGYAPALTQAQQIEVRHAIGEALAGWTRENVARHNWYYTPDERIPTMGMVRDTIRQMVGEKRSSYPHLEELRVVSTDVYFTPNDCVPTYGLVVSLIDRKLDDLRYQIKTIIRASVPKVLRWLIR